MLNYLALSTVISLVAGAYPRTLKMDQQEGTPGTLQTKLFGLEMESVQDRVKRQCEYLFKLDVWNPCPCVSREDRKRNGGCRRTDTCCNHEKAGRWEYRKWICANHVEDYPTSTLFRNAENVAKNEAVPYSRMGHSCQLWVDGPLPEVNGGRVWHGAGFCGASRQKNGEDTVGCAMERLGKKMRTGNAIQVYWVCADICYYDLVPYERPGFRPLSGSDIGIPGVPNPDDYAPWRNPPVFAVIGLLSVAGGLTYWMRKKNEPDYQALLIDTESV